LGGEVRKNRSKRGQVGKDEAEGKLKRVGRTPLKKTRRTLQGTQKEQWQVSGGAFQNAKQPTGRWDVLSCEGVNAKHRAHNYSVRRGRRTIEIWHFPLTQGAEGQKRNRLFPSHYVHEECNKKSANPEKGGGLAKRCAEYGGEENLKTAQERGHNQRYVRSQKKRAIRRISEYSFY